MQHNIPSRLSRGSRSIAVTQAGLFGLNFGTASSTDVQTQKQEVVSQSLLSSCFDQCMQVKLLSKSGVVPVPSC